MLRSRPHYESKVFRSHYARSRNLKTQQLSVSLDLCLRRTRREVSRDYRDVIILEKLHFQNVFRLKSVFEKLRFRNGLVWTVGLTVDRLNLRYQIPPV